MRGIRASRVLGLTRPDLLDWDLMDGEDGIRLAFALDVEGFVLCYHGDGEAAGVEPDGVVKLCELELGVGFYSGDVEGILYQDGVGSLQLRVVFQEFFEAAFRGAGGEKQENGEECQFDCCFHGI